MEESIFVSLTLVAELKKFEILFVCIIRQMKVSYVGCCYYSCPLLTQCVREKRQMAGLAICTSENGTTGQAAS